MSEQAGSQRGTLLACPERAHSSPNQRAWKRFQHNRPAMASLGFLLLLFAFVLLWPMLSHYTPNALSEAQSQPPNAHHWCGTDVHGRDLLARIMFSARISLLVGAVGAAVSLVIGVTWGAVAGYIGGRTDEVMMRFVDVLYALPSVVFVIVLITTLGDALRNLNSPTVYLKDFKNPPGLLLKLRDAADPVAEWIRNRVSEPFRKDLAAYGGMTPASVELQKNLALELNRLLEGPVLFDNPIPTSIRLRTKTKKLLSDLSAEKTAPGAKGRHQLRLNRFLLEDAFPSEIRTRENWFRLALGAIFPPGSAAITQMMFLFIGLGAISWLTMARIVRGQVLSLRSRQFVDASRALGASHARILWRHILPNIYGVIIVYLTLTVPAVILYESFLSYLGLGIQPPMASWGSLIAEGASQLNPVRIYWWLIVFPGAALVTALLALNFLGDGLRDAFDPRTI